MKNNNKIKRNIGIILLCFYFLIIFISCTLPNKEGIDNKDKEKVEEKLENKNIVSIGITQNMDSVPILVAEERGYFKDHGINIKIQMYKNKEELENGIKNGEVDGGITDIITLITFINDGIKIKGTTQCDNSYAIVSNPGFNKESTTASIACKEISVENYLSDILLSETYKLNKKYITDDDDLVTMIKNNEVNMIVLPEPNATIIEFNEKLNREIYAMGSGVMPGIMVFTDRVIESKFTQIEKIHESYNKAIEDIKKDNRIAKNMITKGLELSDEIVESIAIPEYDFVRLPSSEYVDESIKWIEGYSEKDITLTYDKIIENSFVN